MALITSYQLAHPECGKLIYCTRTVPEMEKVLAELRVLQAYREKHVGKASEIMALGLSSRKNMCIHPKVADEGSRESVDARCRRLTASWVREKHIDAASREEETSTELCQCFEDYEKEGPDAVLPPGVYTLADLREFGRKISSAANKFNAATKEKTEELWFNAKPVLFEWEIINLSSNSVITSSPLTAFIRYSGKT